MVTVPCKLSIVCPAYQEEEVLPRFHAELCTVLAGLSGKYEIEVLYVDDGSRDGTLKILHGLAQSDHRVRYLSLSRNFGHQAALTAGLEHARGEVVITLDSDLQHPPSLIPRLLDRWHAGHDVVATLRQDDPSLGIWKRWSSWGFYRVMGWLSDTEVRPAASDFRLLSRRAVDALLRLREKNRFLRGMVNWLGYPVAVVPFQPARRGGGVSKYTWRRMLALASHGLVSFSKVPLRLSLTLGLILSTSALVYGFTAAAAGAFGFLEGGWAVHAILATLLLVGGLVLGSMGILGEYIACIFEEVKGRPLYLLKDGSPDLLEQNLDPKAAAPSSWHGNKAA